MSGEPAFVHTFAVGRWTVALSVPRVVAGAVVCATVEWAPELPDRPLTPSEQRAYERGLATAMTCALGRGFDARTSSASDAGGQQ